VNQWTDFYKKVPDETIDKIRKEIGMEFIETTISEHIFNQGRYEGEIRGKIEGEMKGKIEGKIEGEIKGQIKGEIKGQISLLENLHQQGILSKKKMEKMLIPLRQKLNELYEQVPEAA